MGIGPDSPNRVTRIGAGVDSRLDDRWALNIEVGYFTADVNKRAIQTSTGTEWNVAGADGNIGNEILYAGAGVVYRFQ